MDTPGVEVQVRLQNDAQGALNFNFFSKISFNIDFSSDLQTWKLMI